MEMLIKLVRERPLFYDHCNLDFSNREKKIEAWIEIANIIGSENGNYWRIKWNCLKDNYYKYKRYIENPSKETYKKYRKWPWAEHMRFLNEFAKPSQKRLNKDPIDLNQGDDNETITNEEINSDEFKEIPQIKVSKTRKRRGQFRPDFADKLSEYFKLKDNRNKEIDEVDQDFLNYAQKFKRLPVRSQSIMKLEIVTLFARYELLAEAENVFNDESNSNGI